MPMLPGALIATAYLSPSETARSTFWPTASISRPGWRWLRATAEKSSPTLITDFSIGGTRSVRMAPRCVLSLILVLGLLAITACSPPPSSGKPRRQGPKINMAHFIKNTPTYKGKTITLGLKIDEGNRSEEHTSELQSPMYLVCRLLLEKKKK